MVAAGMQGTFIGPSSVLGVPIDIADADKHIFGLVLLNDWSGAYLVSPLLTRRSDESLLTLVTGSRDLVTLLVLESCQLCPVVFVMFCLRCAVLVWCAVCVCVWRCVPSCRAAS
jgi:hypothetical protein